MSTISPNSNISNTLNPNQLNKGELTQDSFMKLLLKQLQSQNPLNPFDASTMMQQMAQLTGLNATQQLVKSVDAFKSNLGTSHVLEASKLVGKQIQVASNLFQLTDSHEAKGSVAVPRGVEKIDVVITDSAGKPVRTLKLTSPSDGILDFAWDGLDDTGKPMTPGVYTISAIGTNSAGDKGVIPTAATVKVNSVALDKPNGIVILNVDGLGGVSMNDVVKIL